MKTVKDILIAAKDLIALTGWCQGSYALKDGKTFYQFTFSGLLADRYCIVGALEKVAHDFWKQEGQPFYGNKTLYTRLAYDAAHLVVKVAGFDGCLADWNDQDEEAQRLQTFIEGLKKNNTPRDKAKVEINKFKQELKSQNIKPIITKEIVLQVIDKAIAACD